MDKSVLLSSLRAGNTGWSEWQELVELVEKLEFEYVEIEYLGQFLAAGDRLAFGVVPGDLEWPAWIPPYVRLLYGLKTGDLEMAGGYADAFMTEPTQPGSVFSQAGNDGDLGYPLLSVPPNVFPFQTNESGALFHLSRDLDVLYPDVDRESLSRLDGLASFTRVNIRQAILGKSWFCAYSDRELNIVD